MQWGGHDKTDLQYQARGCGHSMVTRHACTKLGLKDLGLFREKRLSWLFERQMVQSEQHVIYRLMTGNNMPWRTTAVSEHSDSQPPKRNTLKSGVKSAMRAATQLASYLEGPLTWIMSLRLHVNQTRNDDGSSIEYKENNTYIHVHLYLLCLPGQVDFNNSVQTMW